MLLARHPRSMVSFPLKMKIPIIVVDYSEYSTDQCIWNQMKI